jgi:hypothetical protein
MKRNRRYVSHSDTKKHALDALHRDALEKTKTLHAHSFFEIVCKVPDSLTPDDARRYATRWVDRGWSADIVTTQLSSRSTSMTLRLRSYVDTFPF